MDKRAALLVLCIVVFLPLVHAAVYYVDPSGNDNNVGSSEQAPWQSITKLNSQQFLAGDTILFKRGGMWTGMLSINAVGTEVNPITFSAYGSGATPILRNPSNVSGNKNVMTLRGRLIVVDGLVIRDGMYGYGILLYANNSIIRNIEATNVCMGVYIAGQHNLVTNSSFHDMVMCRNTPGGDDDYGALGVDILAPYNEVSYNRFENLSEPSYDYGMDGGAVEIFGVADGSRIHHNWARDTQGFMEVGSSGDGSAKNVTASYNVIYNTGTFFGFHTSGNFAIAVDNFRVENNDLIDVGKYNQTQWSTLYFGDNVTPNTFILRNNIIYVDNFWFFADADRRGWNFTHTNNIYYLPNASTRVGYSLTASERMGDPRFVNLSRLVFHLLPTSPAIDAGRDLGYTYDFDGVPVPRGIAPDMGVYEYSTSQTVNRTFYVATTGNDSNPGTQAQPWRTIQKAATTMQSGDSVVVMAGVYNERIYLRRSGLTFRGSGAVRMKGFYIGANYTSIIGFEIAYTNASTFSSYHLAGIYLEGHHALIENNTIHDCGYYGIVFVSFPNANTTTDCVVRGNRLYHNQQTAVDISGRRNLIENNEVWDSVQCHPTAVAILGPGCPNYTATPWLDGDAFHFFGTDHVFRNNYIHGMSFRSPENIDSHVDCFQTWKSSYADPTKNVLFENNICLNAIFGLLNEDGTAAGSGFMIQDASNITIRNNVILAYGGVNAAWGDSNLFIYNNHFISNLSLPYWPMGVSFADVPNMTIINNIFYDFAYKPINSAGSNPGYVEDYNLAYRSDGRMPAGTPATHDKWGVDPQFQDTLRRNWTLRPGSPAIDAGTVVTSVTADFYGIRRPQGQGFDIGAFESVLPAAPLIGDVSHDGKVDLEDIRLIIIDMDKTSGFGNDADLNMDSRVDIRDLAIVARHYGMTSSD